MKRREFVTFAGAAGLGAASGKLAAAPTQTSPGMNMPPGPDAAPVPGPPADYTLRIAPAALDGVHTLYLVGAGLSVAVWLRRGTAEETEAP